MRNKFDMQLELLNEQLTHMGELCEIAINRATRALQEEDLEQAREIIQADEAIDHMEKDIERMCLKLLLQQQPVARDLRQISAALKMITDMERIGDQTADIADIVISANIGKQDLSKIGDMAAGTAKMVRNSVAAYVKRDLELAKKVMEADEAIDAAFDLIKEELITHIVSGEDDGKAIDLIMIAKYLERIGDHATNIAEWVEFSITGIHKGQNV